MTRSSGKRACLPVFEPGSKINVIAAHLSKRDDVGRAGVQW